MFISTDAGESWAQSSFSDCWINRIKRLDNGMIMLSGLRSDYIASSSSADLFLLVSTDDGESWKSLTPIPSTKSFARGSGNSLFIGTYGRGIYRSEDGGHGWTAVNNGLQENISGFRNLYVFDILDGSDGMLFAATAGGVVKSTNNGDSWTRVSDAQQMVSRLLRIDPYTLLAGTDAAIYRSTNLGLSWQSVLSTRYVRDLARASRNRIVAASDEAVFVSDDNGGSWSKTSLTQLLWASLVIPSPNVCVVASDYNRLLRSIDNELSWTQSDQGFMNSTVQSICITRSVLLAIADDVAMRSTDNGGHWAALPTLSNVISIVSSGSDTAYAVGDGIYRSIDQGQSWSLLSTPAVQGPVQCIALTHNSRLFVGKADGTIYRSPDAGKTWELISPNPPMNRVLLISANDNGLVAAGDLNYEVRISTDNGTTWLPGSTQFNNVSIGITQRGDVFIGNTDGVIFRSTNAGLSWTQHTLSGLYGNNVKSIISLGGNDLYAGLYFAGAFKSTDNGQSWLPTNEGLLNKNVISACYAPDGFIYLGTDGGGAFRSLEQTK